MRWKGLSSACHVVSVLGAGLLCILGGWLLFNWASVIALWLLVGAFYFNLIRARHSLLGCWKTGEASRQLCPPPTWAWADLETRTGAALVVSGLLFGVVAGLVGALLLCAPSSSLAVLASSQLGWQAAWWQMRPALTILTPLVILTRLLVIVQARDLLRRAWVWGWVALLAYVGLALFIFPYLLWLASLGPFIDPDPAPRLWELVNRGAGLPARTMTPDQLAFLVALAVDLPTPTVLRLSAGSWYLFLFAQGYVCFLWVCGFVSCLGVLWAAYRTPRVGLIGVAELPVHAYRRLCLAQFILEAVWLILWFSVAVVGLLLVTHASPAVGIGVVGSTHGSAGILAVFKGCKLLWGW